MRDDSGRDNLGDLIPQAARALRRAWTQEVQLEISPHETRALRVIAGLQRGDREPRPSAVADRLRIAPRSATEVIDSLQTKGLVDRAASATDRRAVCIRLTPAGEAMLERIADLRAELADRMFGSLSDSEHQELVRLLRKALDGD